MIRTCVLYERVYSRECENLGSVNRRFRPRFKKGRLDTSISCSRTAPRGFIGS